MRSNSLRILVSVAAFLLLIIIKSSYKVHQYCSNHFPGKSYSEYLEIGEYCSHFKSEADQDRFIYQNYFIDHIYAGKGVFVEIGYNTDSYTLFFEKTLGWNGVIINSQKVNSKNFLINQRKAIKIAKNRKGVNSYKKVDNIMSILNIKYVNYFTINVNSVGLSEIRSIGFTFYAEIVNFHFVNDPRFKSVQNELDIFMQSKNYTIYFILEWHGTTYDYFYIPINRKPFFPQRVRMECRKVECV